MSEEAKQQGTDSDDDDEGAEWQPCDTCTTPDACADTICDAHAPMPPEERVAWVKARAWAVTADLENAARLLREHGYTVIPPRPEDSA